MWLDAGTAVKQLDTLTASPRTWRLLEVQMAGTNVVNRGQQRITPAPGATWTVELLLYDLQVQARDAIFGNAIGGELSLVYPDGSVRVTQLGKDGSGIDYPQLPRGDYTLRLKVAGLGAPTPVALSRDQTAVIRVITYLDLGILGFGLLVAMGAMAWFGRRHQLIRLGQHIHGRSAAAVGANSALLGSIADRGSRAFRDRKRAAGAAVGRSLDSFPWNGVASPGTLGVCAERSLRTSRRRRPPPPDGYAPRPSRQAVPYGPCSGWDRTAAWSSNRTAGWTSPPPPRSQTSRPSMSLAGCVRMR